MTKPTGPQPRFGTDFLFNWLSRPANSPAQALEQQLALTVLTHGRPVYETQAFRYSRNDWEIACKGRTMRLTFQNFASPTGTQSAAYTLTVNNSKGTVLRGVHERVFLSNVPGDLETAQSDEIHAGNPAALQRLGRLVASKTSPKEPVAVPA